MGKKMTAPKPFRRQFITQALWILVLSALASLVLWVGFFFILIQLFQPVNYYEEKIPPIHRWADQEGAALLDPALRPRLEEIVPREGIRYRVVPLAGGPGYGTLSREEVPGKGELIRHLNQSDSKDGNIYVTHPLMDSREGLKGVLILRYPLSLAGSNPGKGPYTIAFTVAFMAVPFVCLGGFTFLFGRRLEKRLTPAVRRLMEGAEKIEKSDLDFSLGQVGGSRELAAIGAAFERMRSALRSSLEKQWRIEQSRREMVAALAHDLFTPLTLIQGHAEQLSKPGVHDEERSRRYVETIRSNAGRAIRLLEEMQEATRLELPTFILRGGPVDVMPFLQQKRDEYTILCGEREIRLQTEFRDERRRRRSLFLDEQRLSQVLDNLMANAVRYTPAGGEVKWRAVVKEESLEMDIADSGPGLSEKDLRFLFDKFYRGDPARSPDQGHAGLGMFIVKTLVEKHGGGISAGNTARGGACFRFWIRELEREGV